MNKLFISFLFTILNFNNELYGRQMREETSPRSCATESPMILMSDKFPVSRDRPLLPVNDQYGHQRCLLVQK